MQNHVPTGFLPERRVIRRQPMQELDQRIMGCVAWGSGLPACRFGTYEHERGDYKKVAIVQAGRFGLAHTNTMPHNQLRKFKNIWKNCDMPLKICQVEMSESARIAAW